MADDLTAMLERGLRDYKAIDSTDPSGMSHLGLDDADYLALAARLGEVVGKWMDLQWYTRVVRERDAARKSEAEAIALVGTLWTRHGHRQTCPIVTDLGTSVVPRWVCNCGWDEIARRVAALLARREEATPTPPPPPPPPPKSIEPDTFEKGA